MNEDSIRLGDLPQPLLDELTPQLKQYQVALLGIRRRSQEDPISYIGSGGFIERRRNRYLLTAAHVWEGLARFEEIGLCIRESVHDTMISRDDIVPYVVYDRSNRDWGPDIAFLKLSQRAIGVIGEERRYLALDGKLEAQTVPKPDPSSGVIAVVGAPAQASDIGRQTAALHAGPWIGGIEACHDRNGFDYFDIGADIGSGQLPEFFGGISGGPAWQVFLQRSRTEGGFTWKGAPDLLGIVLSQSRPERGKCIVRCHGPKSIYLEGPRLAGVP